MTTVDITTSSGKNQDEFRRFGRIAPPGAGRGAVLSQKAYRLALILAIISSYSASVKKVFPGFMAKVPPHSKPSLYLGTRCMCRWRPVSP